MSIESLGQLLGELVLTKLENKEFARVPVVCKAWAAQSNTLGSLKARYNDPSLRIDQQFILLSKLLEVLKGSSTYEQSVAAVLLNTHKFIHVAELNNSINIFRLLTTSTFPISLLRNFILTEEVTRADLDVHSVAHQAILKQWPVMLSNLKYLADLAPKVLVELDLVHHCLPYHYFAVATAVIGDQAAKHYNYAYLLETHLFGPYRSFLSTAHPADRLRNIFYNPQEQLNELMAAEMAIFENEEVRIFSRVLY